MSEKPWKPTKEEIRAAAVKKVNDVIAESLSVLFCGINPGLYTAATGHHFARPGNRFWVTLHEAGFTPRVLSPFEEGLLLRYSLGITNLVERATANAAEISDAELIEGGIILEKKIYKYKPRVLAVLGITAFGKAFKKRAVTSGLQNFRIAETPVWVLPNPSGLNANYQKSDLVILFKNLYYWIKEHQ